MKIKLIPPLTILFGLFYLFSGIVKIIDIEDFLYLIRSYHFKQIIYLAPALPVIEIVVGILLVLRIRAKQVMLFTIVLLLFFTAFFAYGHFFKNIDDCGCFGGVDFLKMSPLVFFIRNFLLISLSIFLYNSLEKKTDSLTFYPMVVLIAIVLVCSIIVGVKSNLSAYTKELLFTKSTIDEYHKNSFLNKNIHETILSDYVSTSKDSTYLIFVFSFKCPHCLASAYHLNSYVNNNIVDNVIGITKKSDKGEKLFVKIVKNNFFYKKIKAIEMSEITALYPVSFYVEGDTIRFKVKGTVPVHEKFRELYFKEEIDSLNTY